MLRFDRIKWWTSAAPVRPTRAQALRRPPMSERLSRFVDAFAAELAAAAARHARDRRRR